MDKITYEFISFDDEKFKEAKELRFSVLFKPYNVDKSYASDELDKRSIHLVALIKNKVIGYCRLTEIDNKGKISNVVVNPQYSKQGIGNKMIKNLLNKSHKGNIKTLYLYSRMNAITFYEKLGFMSTTKKVVSEISSLELQEMYIKLT